jgi:cob(I)alamin adenosyltransferase
MKLDRIYTRGGDGGETSLGDGTRVAKHHIRVRALGGIEEANAAIGVALLHVEDPDVRRILLMLQNDLFDLGADLCVPERPDATRSRLRISAKQVETLEGAIDRFNDALSPLTSFILPGGSPASSHLHVARTIMRRAECDVTELAAQVPLNEEARKYINRVSDLFFVLCRYLNARGEADVLWTPGANR